MAELITVQHLECLLERFGARRVSFAGLWGYIETEQIRHDIDGLRREITQVRAEIVAAFGDALAAAKGEKP